MADTEDRPKAWLPGRKRNPAYDEWRKAQKNVIAKFEQASDAPPCGAFEIKDNGDGTRSVETDFGTVTITGGLPPTKPETLTLRVVKLALNDRYVLCEHQAEKGKTQAVKLLRRGSGGKTLKKSIRVEKRGDGTFHQIA
jgi:hypothetical protein